MLYSGRGCVGDKPEKSGPGVCAVAASGSLAGPALAGPLFSGLLVSFPDCIGTHVLLSIRCAAASDMAHSAPCSSSASQSSPMRRPIAETPHQPVFPVSETTVWKEEHCVQVFSAKLVCFFAHCLL